MNNEWQLQKKHSKFAIYLRKFDMCKENGRLKWLQQEDFVDRMREVIA